MDNKTACYTYAFVVIFVNLLNIILIISFVSSMTQDVTSATRQKSALWMSAFWKTALWMYARLPQHTE